MEDSLLELQQKLTCAQMQQELEVCNRFGQPYGLALTTAGMERLSARRLQALKNTGRLEFGGGVLQKLVEAFCDSPFIGQMDYEDTLAELQDSFYYFKHEAMEALDDDELIERMAFYFNGVCQGSLDLLNGTTLEDLCRRTRGGEDADQEPLF